MERGQDDEWGTDSNIPLHSGLEAAWDPREPVSKTTEQVWDVGNLGSSSELGVPLTVSGSHGLLCVDWDPADT